VAGSYYDLPRSGTGPADFFLHTGKVLQGLLFTSSIFASWRLKGINWA